MNKPGQVKYRDMITSHRRWFPLWTLDRYILREFLIKYTILLSIFIILFILGDVYRDIGDFFEVEASTRDIVMYLLYKLPGNIRFILPISTLLGTMWTMSTFAKNMEITAMRACGVSLFRIGCPIFCIGLIVTAINIYFNEALVPYTEQQAVILYDDVVEQRKHVQNLLAYRSSDHKRHWLFKTFMQGNEQHDVTIKTFWDDNYIRLLIGQPGEVDFNRKLRRVFPVKAERLLALPRAAMAQELRDELLGRKLDIYAGRVGFDEDTGVWTFYDGNFISYDRNDEAKFSASQGTSAIHKSLPYVKLVFSPRELPERPNDIVNAIREKDELSTFVIWDLLRRFPNMAERVRDIYLTVFFYRISFPLSCFLAVFLGIPLATKSERTGSLMAVISAVAIIVIYIVCAQLFLVLGKGGWVWPFVAGVGPTFGFTLYGILRVMYDQN